MKEIGRKVKLLKPFDVSKITVKTDSYFPDAFIIDIPLDCMPDHVWQDIFERTWKSSRHLWDRKIFVMGDKLRLVTRADEFEKKLDWVEQIIEETNKGIDEYEFAAKKKEELTIKEELQKQKTWNEKARIELIKQALIRRYG